MSPLLAAGWSLARAAPMGKQVIDGAAIRTGNLDPVIGAMLAAAGLLPKPSSIPSIRDAAQGYVRRTFDRGDMAIGLRKQTSVFRTPELDPHLPGWFKTTQREAFAVFSDPIYVGQPMGAALRASTIASHTPWPTPFTAPRP